MPGFYVSSHGNRGAPAHTCELTRQAMDFIQGWSNAVADRFTHTDLLAMVAAVFIFIFVKLRYTPGHGTSTVHLNFSKPLQRSSYEDAYMPPQPSEKMNV